jgi:ketosteroid isomerase-like protein
METMEVAEQLVALCREGRNLEAIETLYADDVVSYEVQEPMQRVAGIEAVMEKAHWWQGAHEVHSASVEGPFPNGDQFAVRHTWDITHKESGARRTMDEIALYTVRDGAIVEEKFFYRT